MKEEIKELLRQFEISLREKIIKFEEYDNSNDLSSRQYDEVCQIASDVRKVLDLLKF